MTLRDTAGLALRNLRQAKLRTALTMLGVSIGIASLTGMVSLGVGLQDQIVGRFLQSGVFDAITVTSAPVLGQRGGLRGRGGRAGATQPNASGSSTRPLDDGALKEISALEHVREAYPNLRVPLEMTVGEFSGAVTASGVPMSAKGEGAFQTLTHGQFFTSESGSACMLSLDMAKRIAEGNPGSLIGKNITLTYAAAQKNESGNSALTGFQVQRVEMQCPIVGIVERETGGFPAGGGSLVSGVMIPLAMARSVDATIVTNAQSLLRDLTAPKSYGSLTVKVDQARNTQDVQDQIRSLGYSVFSVSDALAGAKNAFIILDIVLGLIGSIALAVSSLGIVNTMVMSILERTREIGIMKAIGASDADIRRIFLIEASGIGLLGGLLGIAIGWIVGQLINFGANVYIQNQGGTPGSLFSLPLWLMAGAVAFSIGVSLAAGSYPASRAARLNPIQALRHD